MRKRTTKGETMTGKERALSLLESVQHEIDKTRGWRQTTGMKPATDTSDFCNVAYSGLRRLEWWVREIKKALEEDESV